MIALSIQKQLAGDARTIFDVGAERGRYTRRYLDLFPKAAVYAFEPAPVARSVLNEMVENELRLHIIPAAALDVTGETMFNIASADVLSSILDIKPGWTEHKIVTEIIVPTTTLDDFCDQDGVESVDVLKVDVQGAELAVLEGAVGILENGIKSILCEMNYQDRYVGQCWHYEVCAFLAEFGYQLRALFPVYRHGRLLRADGVFTR